MQQSQKRYDYQGFTKYLNAMHWDTIQLVLNKISWYFVGALQKNYIPKKLGTFKDQHFILK